MCARCMQNCIDRWRFSLQVWDQVAIILHHNLDIKEHNVPLVTIFGTFYIEIHSIYPLSSNREPIQITNTSSMYWCHNLWNRYMVISWSKKKNCLSHPQIQDHDGARFPIANPCICRKWEPLKMHTFLDRMCFKSSKIMITGSCRFLILSKTPQSQRSCSDAELGYIRPLYQ